MMRLRFSKRERILPAVTLNLSKRGASIKIRKGAHLTVGISGATEKVGVPGTGVYWTRSSLG
jgi:hypothetical protein